MRTEESLPVSDDELLGLDFLRKFPGHVIGLLDTEQKLAAAFVFGDLINRSLAVAELTENGTAYHLSRLGRRVLEHEADRLARVRVEGISRGGAA